MQFKIQFNLLTEFPGMSLKIYMLKFINLIVKHIKSSPLYNFDILNIP